MTDSSQNANKFSLFQSVSRALLCFLAFVGSEYLAKLLAFSSQSCPGILPSFGLFFGVLLVTARKDWLPCIVAGLGASIVAAVVIFHQSPFHGVTMFAGNLLQAVLGWHLLRMPGGKAFTFRKVKHVARFGAVTAGVAILGASFASLTCCSQVELPKCWVLFWFADIAGLFVVAPLVVVMRREYADLDRFNPWKIAEAALLFISLAIAGDCIFGHLIPSIYPGIKAQPYQIFPILLWAGIRFGARGAALASFALAIVATLGTSHNWCKAFQAASVSHRALLLDIFLLTSSAFSMIAASLMAERLRSASKFRRLFHELDQVNQVLKQEVAERTRAGRMLRAILDGANACILSTDVNGVISTFNAAAQNLLNYTAEEVVGRMNLVQLHDPGELETRAKRLSEQEGSPIPVGFEALALPPAKGKTQELEWTYLGKDGKRADVVVSMTALFDHKRQPTGYIVASRDITLQKKAEAALVETRSAVHTFFVNGPLMMGVVEIAGDNHDIIHISDNIAAAEFHGTTPEAMSHRLASSLGDTQVHIDFWIGQYRKSEAARQPVKFEYELQIGSKLMHLRATVGLIAVGPSGRSRFSYVMEDITDYRQAQAQLKRFAAILEATTDFVGMADRTGKTLYLNGAARQLIGLDGKEIPVGHRIYNVHPEWASLLTRREGIPVAMLEGVWQGESAVLNTKEEEIPVSQVILSHRSAAGDVEFISTIVRDMTERKLAEERIRGSLYEKEALLKEIHHRVKNNMQVVSSLLQLQSGYTQDSQAKAMFEESRDRIRSMALIHEKLYQTKDLALIDFSEYIPSLINMIFATQNVRTGVIRSQISVGAVSFGVDTAIPLGLVINELVSNSLKHGFKGRETGTVTIELQNPGRHEYSLVVRDDGVGLPPGFEIDSTSSLGLKLVRILAQQIGGELTITNQNGSYFQIKFKVNSTRE